MKKLLTTSIIVATPLLYAFPVLAATPGTQTGAGGLNACPGGGPFEKLCLDASKTGDLVGAGLAFIFVIAALIALGFLIWGGIKWLMSGGDKSALEEARNHIIAAIIGLVIIFLSFFIINVVLGFFFPNFSLKSFQLPSL